MNYIMNEEKTVKKKVYAYSIKSTQDLLQTFKLVKQKINNDFTNLEERKLIYTEEKTGLKYFLEVRKIKTYKEKEGNGKLDICECILYKLRNDDFPYLFDILTGKKTPLDSKVSDTIMEQTHFIVVPKLNILISEYNHFGAVPTKLIFIVDKILGPLYSSGFEVKHILNTETAYRLKNMDDIETMSIKCGHQGLKTIGHYLNVNFLDVMDKGFRDTSDLEFKFTISGKGRGSNKKKIDLRDNDKFKRLCNLIFNSKNKKNLDIHSAKLIERKGNLELKELPIDLFSDYFVEEVTAIRLSNRSRYIDSDDMFYKLIGLYNTNKFEMSNFKEIEYN